MDYIYDIFIWVIFMGNRHIYTLKKGNGDRMPTVENVNFEMTNYLRELEAYVEEFKKLPQQDAKEISKRNLIDTGIIDEQGNLTGFYKNT